MMRWWLAVGVLVVGACATTPEERAARIEAEVEAMIDVYGPGCERLGYKRDTDPWRACVLKLSRRNDYRYQYPRMTTCVGHRGFYHCTGF